MLSILIPLYNESALIESFLSTLIQRIQNPAYIQEIILIDGESTDDSYTKIEHRLKSYSGALSIMLIKCKKSRAAQQNAGAKIATGKLFFFLHIDCMPEQGFESVIYNQCMHGAQGGVCQFSRTPATRYTVCIDRIYNTSFFYRCRFGDSGIIVSKELFCTIGGFNEHWIIEEDHMFIMQLWKSKNFTIYPINLFVSDRVFRMNGFIKTLCTYTLVHGLFLCGCSQSTLLYIARKIKGIKS